jgi:transcriptional regulator with XRE-family HTH domain
MALAIGRTIREIRQGQGLPLSELARRSGVTPSLLSQVERGLASPSLHTLREVAAALNVPLATFFREPVTHSDIVLRAADRPRLSLPGDEAEYELLTPRASRRLQLGLVRLAPGKSTAGRGLAHAADEVAFVLAGEVEVEWDDERIRLSAGDSIFIPEGVRHRWVNVGAAEARVAFAMTPPAF